MAFADALESNKICMITFLSVQLFLLLCYLLTSGKRKPMTSGESCIYYVATKASRVWRFIINKKLIFKVI